MHVLVAGGGTAGHVNPALALAAALRGDSVTFIGTTRGVEARLVPAAGHRFETIEVRGFDRSQPWTLPSVGAGAVRAVSRARSLMQRVHPDVVVGMGGYVSLPAAWAAAILRVPIVLHEQNIVLGLAHRASKPFARRVAVSFEETLQQTGNKGVFVGNPIAEEFGAIDRDREREAGLQRFGLDEGRRTLLVFGGSLGARSINEATLELARIWAERDDLQILHVAGPAAFDDVSARAPREGALLYRVVPYVDRMLEAYAVADAGVCRGGATTVAEIAAAGLPCVIVPYPYHRDRQQERHARVLAGAGAARVMTDQELAAPKLAAVAEEMMSPQVAEPMRAALQRIARPRAAHDLARVVHEAAA